MRMPPVCWKPSAPPSSCLGGPPTSYGARRGLWHIARMRRALLSAAVLAATVSARPNALRASQMARQLNGTGRLSLLVLLFTQKQNTERRAWQRSTFLGAKWRRGADGPFVNWRYTYVQARDNTTDPTQLDRVVGDVVTLSAVWESYANLVFKTLEAVRWAVQHVRFDALLKTDDDTMVHLGRAAAWLASRAVPPRGRPPPRLYAGRVFNDSQVIRANFSRRDL